MNIKRKWLSAVAVAAVTLGLGGFIATQANADQPSFICTETGEGWQAKVDTTGDPATVTVTAPEGFLIDAYCVKAGAAEDAKVIVQVIPPAATVVIDHPTKDSVSHYQIHLIPIVEESPSPSPSPSVTPPVDNPPVPALFNVPTTAATCTDPETFDAVFPLDREGYTITVDRPYDGPGVYTLTAVPDEGVTLSGDTSVEVTLTGELVDEVLCPTDVEPSPSPEPTPPPGDTPPGDDDAPPATPVEQNPSFTG